MKVFVVVENFRPDPYTYTYESVVKEVFTTEEAAEKFVTSMTTSGNRWYDVIEKEAKGG